MFFIAGTVGAGSVIAAVTTRDAMLQLTATFALTIAWATIVSPTCHELGHALAARRAGIGIEQFGVRFCGGYVRLRSSALGVTPRTWIRVLRAGPMTNAVMAVGLLLIGMLGVELYSLLGAFFLLAATSEICVAVINLLPPVGPDGSMIRQARVIARSPASI